MIDAFAALKPKAKLTPFKYDPGELEPDEVEINVKYCGLCYSDVSFIENEWGITQYPVVPGHEVIGSISALGNQVKHLTHGQTVGLGAHAGYCNHCELCRSGDHNLCQKAQMTNIGHHGGFADKVRAAANSVIPIPDAIDQESAGPLLCGGITVFNPLVTYNVRPTDRVAVIGIGGLGHLALQFLRAWGCEVTAFTSADSKKKEALNLGAHYALNSRDAEEIKSTAGRFDVILCTVNVKLDWNLYTASLSPRGRLIFLGVVMDPLDINLFPMMVNQLSLSSSLVGSPGTIVKMLDFAALHKIKPVVEKYKFYDVNKAIERLKSGKARYRIVLCH